jgi:hypothetical protein
MKAFALCAVLVASVGSAGGNAPADRYFGKLKMSALRIRYEIMQLRPRYETHKLLPEEAEHLAVLDEDAFDDWAAEYPHDAWLASTAYLLAQFYRELPGSDARARAMRLLAYVRSHFPNSVYARDATAALKRGIPNRPDPAWAVAMRAARASPQPSAAPSPAEALSPSPAPSATRSTPPSIRAASLSNGRCP